jgi:uncharacterized protein YegP (UPF0339 family)
MAEYIEREAQTKYYVVRDKNTGLYFRGKGVNRWGKYYNQASVYRVKANAENAIEEVSWRGEQAEVVEIRIVETTADVVEVRHGEWVEHDESKDDFYHHRCSICKVDAPFNYVETEDYDEGMDGEWCLMGLRIADIVEHLTNYCPNCGAKMDGKGEGDG